MIEVRIVKWTAAILFTVIVSVMAGMIVGAGTETIMDGVSSPLLYHNSVAGAKMISASLVGFFLGRLVKP